MSEQTPVDYLIAEYGYTSEEFNHFSYQLITSDHTGEKGILLCAVVLGEQMSLVKWWNSHYDGGETIILYAVREFFHEVAVKIQRQRCTISLPTHTFTRATTGLSPYLTEELYKKLYEDTPGRVTETDGTSTLDATSWSVGSVTDGTYH